MAEECDRVSAVHIYSDLSDGFCGLAASILQEVRDEAPSAFIPLWGFDDSPSNAIDSDLSMSESIRSLNMPLSYARMIELASVVIPINPNGRGPAALMGLGGPALSPLFKGNSYRKAALVAAAIDTCVSGWMREMRSVECRQQLTAHGRFPVAVLEACAPFPAGGDTPHPTFLANSFEREFARTTAFDLAASNARLNPFVQSLSVVGCGPLAVPRGFALAKRTKKAYVNVLSVSGVAEGPAEGMLEDLFARSVGSSYALSRFCSSPAAVNFPHSFYEEPDGGGSGEGGGSAGEVQGMSVAAAVGSDEGVGMHLLRCAGRWAELTQGGPGARRMAAQMDKVCMEAGERAEVHETLLNLAQRYEVTNVEEWRDVED